MKRLTLLLTAMGLLAIPGACAHPGHEHHETPTPVAVAAPPPPAPPPPPPIVIEPPRPVMNVQFNLPVIAPNMLTPTDMTGIGGSLGYARGLKNQLVRPGGKPQSTPLIARDTRFDFGGDWIPFAGSEPDATQTNAAAESKNSSAKHSVKIEKWVPASKSRAPLFMATSGAAYVNTADHLTLKSGAVIVRAGSEAVTVNIVHNGQNLTVKISSDALALISNFDDKPIVLNLTDRCCGAVVVTTKGEKTEDVRISLGVGEMFEMHQHCDKPFTTYLASKVISNKAAGNGLSYQLTRCHYLSVIRRFNLDKSLQKNDLSRVLKTAAALAHVNPGGRN